MFGREQAHVQPSRLGRTLFRVAGDPRFPLRVRVGYLDRSLPAGFAPARIWDAGCGQGHTSFHLARRFPQAEVFGTDLNPAAVDHCRAIAARAGVRNAAFDTFDLTHTPPEAAYDLIVCFEVLEHVDEYALAVRNFSRALRPGGLLVAHTPAVGRFQSERFGLRPFKRADTVNHAPGQFHVREGFNPDELRAAAGQAGLAVDRLGYTFGPWSMWCHTAYELTRRRSRLWQAAALPFLLPVAWVDARRTHREGGALMLVARKPAAPAGGG